MKQKAIALLALCLCAALLLPIGANAADIRSFYDVRGHWAYESIDFCTEYGLMSGTSAHHFAPDETLSRAMFCTVLFRLYSSFFCQRNGGTLSRGLPPVPMRSFSDVRSGQWYTNAVCWAAAEGIVSGMPDGTFSPNASIDRAQMAVMLSRFADLLGPASGNGTAFRDAKKIPSWAVDGVKKVSTLGWLVGDANGNFNPTSGTTRAQAASVFERVYRYLSDLRCDPCYLCGTSSLKTVRNDTFDGTALRDVWTCLSESGQQPIVRNTYPYKLNAASVAVKGGKAVLTSSYRNGTLYSGGFCEAAKTSAGGKFYEALFTVPADGCAMRTEVFLAGDEGDVLTVSLTPWDGTVRVKIGIIDSVLHDAERFRRGGDFLVAISMRGGRCCVCLDGAELLNVAYWPGKRVSFGVRTVFDDGCGILFPTLLPAKTEIDRITIYQ